MMERFDVAFLLFTFLLEVSMRSVWQRLLSRSPLANYLLDKIVGDGRRLHKCALLAHVVTETVTIEVV